MIYDWGRVKRTTADDTDEHGFNAQRSTFNWVFRNTGRTAVGFALGCRPGRHLTGRVAESAGLGKPSTFAWRSPFPKTSRVRENAKGTVVFDSALQFESKDWSVYPLRRISGVVWLLLIFPPQAAEAIN